MRVPQNRWFIMEHAYLSMDDLGVPPFQEMPNDLNLWILSDKNPQVGLKSLGVCIGISHSVFSVDFLRVRPNKNAQQSYPLVPYTTVVMDKHHFNG